MYFTLCVFQAHDSFMTITTEYEAKRFLFGTDRCCDVNRVIGCEYRTRPSLTERALLPLRRAEISHGEASAAINRHSSRLWTRPAQCPADINRTKSSRRKHFTRTTTASLVGLGGWRCLVSLSRTNTMRPTLSLLLLLMMQITASLSVSDESYYLASTAPDSGTCRKQQIRGQSYLRS